MSGDIPNRGEQRLADALRPFGWTCGPDFWPRYYADPWVFSLANAVERVTAENQRLRDELRSEQMERSDAEREADRLRAAIEKLRDDADASPLRSSFVARRLTEMLDGDFQEHLDRARVKYRGALDELRDK